MTDVAALALNIDSTSVVKAANDLDRFSAAAQRAGTATGSPTGSIAKLVATIQSMDSKLNAIVGALDKISRGMGSAARATQVAAAANDNLATSAASVSRAFENADAHVNAYRNRLQSLVADQARVSAAFASADAHVLAYAEHLRNAASIPTSPGSPAPSAPSGSAGSAPSADFTETGRSAQLASHHVQNLAFQLNDVFVSLASGQQPLTVFVQQGSQIAQIYAQAGLGLRGFATAVAGLLAPFLPLVAVLAVAAAGIAALTAQANDDSGLKKYTKAMGYTAAEVKKLNAVTVTFGDTMKAVFQVGWDRIASAFGLTTDDLSKKWSSFTDWMVTATRASIAGVYAAFTGMQNIIPRILDNIKSGKKEGLLEIVGGSFADQYKEAQAFMDDVTKQAGKNARDRQDAMAKAMYDKPSAGAHKYDFSDVLKDADKIRNDLNTAAAQVGLYGEALARVTYEQDLLNKASEHGLKLSPAQRSAIAGVAAELAKLAEANRLATFRENTKQAYAEQFQALKSASDQIGVYGRDLVALRYEQEMLNQAVAQHVTVTEKDLEQNRKMAEFLADKDYANIRAQSAADNAKSHAEAMRQLDVERGALGLTGQALISYNYQQELINKALEAGVTFKDLDIEKTRKQGDAYAAARYAIDQQTQAIADAREVTKSFFSDWINGVREGGNLFKTFADSVIGSLNRIIDKLLDKTLNSFLDSMFSSVSGGSAGGLFSSIFGGSSGTSTLSSGLVAPKNMTPWEVAASNQKFAKGGTFTNSIVNSPTLFRFANGGALGEMGEAGPEAIMPLKRGPNGALGVQVHGGGGRSGGHRVDVGGIQQNYYLTGTVSQNDVENMVRQGSQQGAEAAVNTVRRNFDSYLREWDTDGAVST